MITLKPDDALIVVDMQNDFMPGGALPVAAGDTIVPGVNGMMRLFHEASLPVVLTQDWHPPGHRSFASSHTGRIPYDLFEEPGIGPVLWPDHCVQGSDGAGFHRDLQTSYSHLILRKGFHPEVDSYSGFVENDKKTRTGLDGYLRSRGVKRIFLCGLALDYCVFSTASDGIDCGFEVVVFTELSKPVGAPQGSVTTALESMSRKGVAFASAGAVRNCSVGSSC
jgi:nicotinamidase/pyrazinamidase